MLERVSVRDTMTYLLLWNDHRSSILKQSLVVGGQAQGNEVL
jgi:hypothetical protein